MFLFITSVCIKHVLYIRCVTLIMSFNRNYPSVPAVCAINVCACAFLTDNQFVMQETMFVQADNEIAEISPSSDKSALREMRK